MTHEKNIIAVIPARGGSKGIPKKNLALLTGKPLLAYAIEVGVASPLIDDVFVSTDDAEIAAVAKKYHADVIDRPVKLAQDTTPDYPVFSHAITWLKEHGIDADILVNLRPTCPLRLVEDVNAAVQKMLDTGCDAVRTVTPADHHPYWMVHFEDDQILPFIDGIDIRKYYQRQLLPPAYRFNGGVDVMSASVIVDKKDLYGSDIRGVIMPAERSIDIDTEIDIRMAEILLEQREKS